MAYNIKFRPFKNVKEELKCISLFKEDYKGKLSYYYFCTLCCEIADRIKGYK
jgi:hypothetical protein